MANVAQQINIGPMDLALAINIALPAAAANVTTGVLDLQSIAPNGDAWRTGRIAVIFPTLAENTAGAGLTIGLRAAPPSLTTGAAAVAPATPVPGAFVTPLVAQTLTVPAVASTGSVGAVYYFTLAFDENGSPYQFYQFIITTPAQVATVGEIVTIGFVDA